MTFSLQKTTLGVTIAAGVGLLVSMFLTTPDQLGPFGITLWFTGLLVSLGGVATLFINSFGRWLHRSLTPQQRFSLALRHGVLFSTWITALLALHSLRQLSLKDIVLVSVLVLLIEFYLRRLR